MDWLGLIGAVAPSIIGGIGSYFESQTDAATARAVAAAGQRTAGVNARLASEAVSSNIADYESALAKSMDELTGGELGAVGHLQEGRDLQDPWRQAGVDSLSGLRDAMGLGGEGGYDRARANFQEGPGYQWQMEQGIKASEAGAAGRGGLYSGAQGKALTQYGQGMANQEWANHLSRLAGVSGSGQQASATMGGFDRSMADARFKGAAGRSDVMLGQTANIGNTRLAGAAMTGMTNNAALQAGNFGRTGVSNAWNMGLNNLADAAMSGLGGGLSFWNAQRNV